MLFILDKSLGNIAIDDANQHQALLVLLSAYQNQHHLIFMEMSSLKVLKEKIEGCIGFTGEKILNTLYNKMPQYKSFVDTVKYRVVVYLEDSEHKGIHEDDQCWHVPLRYFKNGLLQSTILAENDRDTELYVIFSEFYRVKNNLNAFNIPVRRRSGGGSGIPRSLESYIEGEYSPCLCLTDSDKLHPRYGESATSKSCRTISLGSRNIIKHIALEERELENLIPMAILEKISPDFPVLIKELREVRGYNDEMWRYLDIKSGCSLGWIRRRDPPTIAYWTNFVHHFERKRRQCLTCDTASIEEVENCSCSIINGLGERLLEKTVEYLRNSNRRATLKLLSDDERWASVGQVIFEFLLAPVGERARV